MKQNHHRFILIIWPVIKTTNVRPGEPPAMFWLAKPYLLADEGNAASFQNFWILKWQR
jgi:hypothetical protein